MSSRSDKRNPLRSEARTEPNQLSRSRLWIFRCILILLPFVLLALFEIALRLGGYGYNPHFFRQVTINGENFCVQNEDFSRRFFPKAIARNPGPVRFRLHKKPGTYRIFILGESAAMGDPAQSFAPDRYLEMLLRNKYPRMEFEVLNVAFTAINSHVILPIARECAAHEADLWIVYMGNNEMVGPFGVATVFGAQAPALPYIRLALAVQRLRTGQLLMDLGRKLGSRARSPAAWGGMTMFLNNQVTPDNPRKETVYRNFQRNLDDIVRLGLGSGAKVLLNTVAVNLKDCPPFASTTNSHLSSSDRAQLDVFYSKGTQAIAQNQFAKAADFLEKAAQLDAKCAQLQFSWGESLLAQTNSAAAQKHFQLARDYDALPFRADSRINAEIRAEKEKLPGQELILLDAAAALAAGSDTAMCGQETFYEHVHFSFDGRYRLGRAWADQIAAVLPPTTNSWASQQICDDMLGLSAWNRAQVVHFMLERLQLPPLSDQANNGRRKNDLQTRMLQLQTQMNAANAGPVRKEFVIQIEQRPEDYFLHQEFALFLELTGDLAAATGEWQRFRELLPQDSLGHYQTGRLLISQQRYVEAETSLRLAVAIRPNRTDAWIELGNALALQKKYSEALACYETALKADPGNAQTLLRRGKVLGYMNRHAEAIESYRQATRLNPSDGLSHYELALELLAAKELASAGKEFAEAARFTPDRVAARFNYGTWLMNSGHREEARREFEAVLRLEPGNLQAQKKLAALETATNHRP